MDVLEKQERRRGTDPSPGLIALEQHSIEPRLFRKAKGLAPAASPALPHGTPAE